MGTVSQRELRNDNASVVRRVEAGESVVVTRNGVPVAQLVPLTASTDLHCDRPARRRPVFSEMPRVRIDESTADLLDDLRGER